MRAATPKTAIFEVFRVTASRTTAAYSRANSGVPQRASESIRYLEWVWSIASTGIRRARDRGKRHEDDQHR